MGHDGPTSWIFLFNILVSGVIFYFLLAFGLGADLSDTLMDRMVKHEKYSISYDRMVPKNLK